MVHLPVWLTPGRRVAGDGISDVLQSTSSSALYSSVVQVGPLPIFLNQWRSIVSIRFLLEYN